MIFIFLIFDVEQVTLNLLASVSKRLWYSINKKNTFSGEIALSVHS